jgi:ribosomal protein S24E
MKNFKVLNDKKNPLFKRRELELEIESMVIPSKSDIQKRISEDFSSPEENIFVKSIKGKFGSRILKIFAFIYDSKEIKESIEFKKKKKLKKA